MKVITYFSKNLEKIETVHRSIFSISMMSTHLERLRDDQDHAMWASGPAGSFLVSVQWVVKASRSAALTQIWAPSRAYVVNEH